MQGVQGRINKLERALSKAECNSPIAPSVKLIESDGFTRTYSVTLGGEPVDRRGEYPQDAPIAHPACRSEPRC
jgi:hypothetical protein